MSANELIIKKIESFLGVHYKLENQKIIDVLFELLEECRKEEEKNGR